MTAEYENARKMALEAVAEGDPVAALSVFRPAVAFPGPFDDAARFKDALEVLARMSDVLPGEIDEALTKASKKPTHAATLLRLGFALLEEDMPDVAATVLFRARALNPGDGDILSELVCALEELGRYPDAKRILDELDVKSLKSTFEYAYMLAFNAMMCANLDEPKQLLPRLRKTSDPELKDLAEDLAHMLRRADGIRGATPLDLHDERGWHFVVTGGLMLMTPNHRADSPARMAASLQLLQSALVALRMAPKQVISVAEEYSWTLARVASDVLSLPLVDLEKDPAQRGLVVTYDTMLIEEEAAEALQWHHEGQTLFTQMSSGEMESPFAADVVGFIGDDEDEEIEDTLIVRTKFAEPEAEMLQQREAVEKLCAAIMTIPDEAAAGIFRRGGMRRRQRLDNPVRALRR